jgi:hypothetical protein
MTSYLKLLKQSIAKLDKGDHLSDEELSTSIRVLSPVVETLQAINRRRYDLVTWDIDNDLQRLIGFQQARKERL